MRSKAVAYLLWFFLGWAGIHRFYCRKWVTGSIWLLTFGLLGSGWFADAIVTSRMVDEANGLPKVQVSTRLQDLVRILRNYGIGIAAMLGLVVFFNISFWVSERLDTRTPAQKAEDAEKRAQVALAAKHRRFRELKRAFPTMEVDGEAVPVQVEWASDGLAIAMPKTYGFGATRFVERTKTIGKIHFKRTAQEFEGNYFLNIGVKIWYGPSESSGLFLVSIPKSVIPSDFQKHNAQRMAGGRPADLTTHVDKAHGFSIRYPNNWETFTADEIRKITNVVNPPANKTWLFAVGLPDRTVNMQVVMEKLDEPMTPAQYFDQAWALAQDAPFKTQSLGKEPVTIGDSNGFKHTILAATLDGRPHKSVALHLVRGQIGWNVIIGGRPEAMDNMTTAVDRILASMTFSDGDDASSHE